MTPICLPLRTSLCGPRAATCAIFRMNEKHGSHRHERRRLRRNRLDAAPRPLLARPSSGRPQCLIRVEAAVLDPLRATRGPGSGLSVIGDLSRMRMTAMGGEPSFSLPVWGQGCARRRGFSVVHWTLHTVPPNLAQAIGNARPWTWAIGSQVDKPSFQMLSSE